MDCRECVLSKHEKGVVVWCTDRQKWVSPDTGCDRKRRKDAEGDAVSAVRR